METRTEILAPLREAIRELDGSILELLRRRMELAAEIGRIKCEHGLPIVDRGVEEGVLHRVRLHAPVCGVSEETLVAVFRAILQGSVERQQRERAERLAEP